MTVGYVLLGFGIAYAIAQIVAGLLLDRYGVTLVGRIASVCAAVFGLLPALVGSFGTFFAARAVFGLDKTLAYPMSVKATGYWFPIAERGLATAIFDAAAKLATAVAIPLLTLILAGYGWRATFLITGVISLLFFVAFTCSTATRSGDQRLDPCRARVHQSRRRAGGRRSDQRERRGNAPLPARPERRCGALTQIGFLPPTAMRSFCC